MNIEEIDFQTAGEGLLRRAKDTEFSPRGKVSELFPYIWEASRRLSTRAISRYLAENHGIKLSAVSVAKALKNPEKYWEEFAEFVEPRARIVADAHNTVVEDVLFNYDLFSHLKGEPPTVSGGVEGVHEHDAAYHFVQTRWYSLSEGARDSCYHYLVQKGDESEEASSDE